MQYIKRITTFEIYLLCDFLTKLKMTIIALVAQ